MGKLFIIRGYECYVNSNNVHIVDSYKVKDIDGFIAELRETIEGEFQHKRTAWAWSNEWYAHNLAYKAGILRSHSGDVDLNDDEYLVAKILYILVKPIAKLVCR